MATPLPLWEICHGSLHPNTPWDNTPPPVISPPCERCVGSGLHLSSNSTTKFKSHAVIAPQLPSPWPYLPSQLPIPPSTTPQPSLNNARRPSSLVIALRLWLTFGFIASGARHVTELRFVHRASPCARRRASYYTPGTTRPSGMFRATRQSISRSQERFHQRCVGLTFIFVFFNLPNPLRPASNFYF